MIQYEHKSYEFYKKVQRRLTAKKTNNGKVFYAWISEKEIVEVNRLIHIYAEEIHTIVCHGCRCGLEVDVLQRLNPKITVFGTDIYGDAYQFDRTYFREMDFDTVPKEWMGYFDVVYSNSLDHSRDPINTLLSWKLELKENGILFVNFDWGKGVSSEDCFHIDGIDYRAEIIEIGDKVGMKILYISETINKCKGLQGSNVVLCYTGEN